MLSKLKLGNTNTLNHISVEEIDSFENAVVRKPCFWNRLYQIVTVSQLLFINQVFIFPKFYNFRTTRVLGRV